MASIEQSNVFGQNPTIFLVTNEMGQEDVQDSLENMPTRGNAIVGTSCFMTLNLASIPRDGVPIEHIAIFDIADRVSLFWNNIAPLIERAQNREEFLQNLREDLEQNAHSYFNLKGVSADKVAERKFEELTYEMDLELSWLSNDERFTKVQEIFRRNRFAFHQLDFTNPEQVGRFLGGLERNGARIDTFYVSNIGEVTPSYPQYIESVRLIPNNAIFIRSATDEESEGPIQILSNSPDPSLSRKAFGKSLLHYGELNDVRSLRELISMKADPNWGNEHGDTPLIFTADADRLEALQLLIEAKADVARKSNSDLTALHLTKSGTTTELLIQRKADVNASDEEQSTPLHFAIENAQRDKVTVLLNYKANPHLRNSHGKSALDLAEEQADLEDRPNLPPAKLRDEIFDLLISLEESKSND
jgi:hypothetical protein